jgi:hypothetical protein
VYVGEPLTLGGEAREPEIISSDHPDPLRIEWVYLLNCEKNIIQVLTHRFFKWVAPPRGSKVSIGSHGIIHDGPKSLPRGRWHYGHCICGHIHVGDLAFDEQPDFEALEAKAGTFGRELTLYDVFGFEKSHLFKKLLKASATRFIKKAKSLSFERTDLGKKIVISSSGSGIEYKILGLEDDRGQSIILGRQKSGHVERLSVDAVLTALGRSNQTPSLIAVTQVNPERLEKSV